ETVAHPRNLVLVGEGSQATIVESHAGPEGASYLTNAVTEIVAGARSIIEYCKLDQEGGRGQHFATVAVRQGRESRFTSHAITLGGALVRNDLTVALEAEGAECALDGLYLTSGRQHVDNHTTIDHVKPQCVSRELYKGILDGDSSAVFNGRIVVRK